MKKSGEMCATEDNIYICIFVYLISANEQLKCAQTKWATVFNSNFQSQLHMMIQVHIYWDVVHTLLYEIFVPSN